MIRLEDVVVKFNEGRGREHIALNHVNLEIKEKDFVLVIGGNGAGKTTLLRILAGSQKVTSGKIFIDNIDVTKLDEVERAKFIAKVFQDPLQGSCADLSIEENFALFASRGQKRTLFPALTKNRINDFHEQVERLGLGLETRMRDPIGSLSGGQRQILTLLMATQNDAKLLLLDEHTAALDPKIAKQVMKITNEIITRKQLTTLMITHDMHHANQNGNRLLVLQKGKILHDIRDQAKEDFCPSAVFDN
jgi:putative ABC transport system ATP-binding protein